jgi:hypothetical protein
MTARKHDNMAIFGYEANLTVTDSLFIAAVKLPYHI